MLVKKTDLLQEEREERIATDFFNHVNDFHKLDVKADPKIEQLLLEQQKFEISRLIAKPEKPHKYIFSPSGTSKCKRELYYKLKGEKPVEQRYPYQRRWTRNSTAIHSAIQRDLLYAEEYLDNPKFKVMKLDETGLPAWEENLKSNVILIHNNMEFAIQGMMDGVLIYKDGTHIGFEFKTKSNTNAQVGNYLLKDVADGHKLQAVAYSLLFGIDEFIFMYEAVAKDSWSKGEEARKDIRTFYYKVTDEDRKQVLDKFAEIVESVETDTIPEMETNKCTFCTYKHLCGGTDNAK